MAVANIAQIVTEAWDDTLELARYGHAPLTVGWLRGQAYVYVWNFRRGAMEWRPFVTARRPPPKPPCWDPFNSSYLFKAFF